MRLCRGQIEKVAPHRLVIAIPLGFEPIVQVAPAAPALGGRYVDHDGQVREQTGDGPVLQVSHLADSQGATGALIGDRGVDITIGQHHRAARQRRADDLFDVLGLVGGENQRFRARRHVVTVQDQVAQGLAQGGAAWLPGADHLPPGRLEVRREQPNLRRLARAVPALEGDEKALIHAAHPNREGRQPQPRAASRARSTFPVALRGNSATTYSSGARAPILPEDVIRGLLRPVRSGRAAAWSSAAGLAGFGAAPLVGQPVLAWPALAAGAVAAGGQVARGRRLRERRVVAIGIIGGLSRLIGPRNVDIDVQRTRGVAASSWVMDRRTVVMRQWTRGRASVPARIEIRYHPAIDAGAAWQGEVLRVLEGKTGHRYQVAGVYPRRRLLSLRLDPSPAPQQEMVTPAQARLQRGVATLIGPTARTGDVVLDGEGQIVGFRITHDVGAKLAARGYRIRVEKTLETMLPGRWRAHWDLEGDTVRFEVRPALPRQVWMPIPAPLDTADVRGIRIPYAVDEDGHEIAWLPGKVPHFLITGQTGAGKTSTARAVIAGVTRHGWPIWIADVKRIEFRDFRDWPNVQAVATGIEQIVAMIHAAHQVMSGRYQLVERGAARPSDFEPLFVFIDEYTEFINLLRSWYATVKIKGDPSVPRTLDEVASLLRLGRTGRVHLVITGQRPDVALFGTGEMRDNLGQRASMGRLSPKGAEMMWESASTGVSIPRGLIGRMTTTNDDGLPVEARGIPLPATCAPTARRQRENHPGLSTAAHPSRPDERLLIRRPSRSARAKW